jgi:hypothetical protein
MIHLPRRRCQPLLPGYCRKRQCAPISLSRRTIIVILPDGLFAGFRTSVGPNFNLRQHEHSKSPDMTEPTTPSGHQRHLREKAVDEFSRLVILFEYLRVVFELFLATKASSCRNTTWIIRSTPLQSSTP